MKNTIFITGVLVAAVSVVATSTLAFGSGKGMHSEGMPGMRMTFAQLDTDGDGQITASEMKNKGTARFNEADTDGNGKLSQTEMEVQGRKRATDRVTAMITQFDKDGDGALSQDEMPKPRRMGRMFDHFDQDDSGGISEQEFTEAREGMRGWMKGRDGKHGRKHDRPNCGDKN